MNHFVPNFQYLTEKWTIHMLVTSPMVADMPT